MNLEKQTLLLSYILSHPDIFPKVNGILKPKYFDPQLKNAAKFIKEYFSEYKVAPNADQVQAETGTVIKPRPEMSVQELRYAESEIESFCQDKAIEDAIMSSVPLIEQKRRGEILELIKEAILVSLSKDLGTDYFSDPELRLKHMLQSNNTISSGFLELDELLAGGLNRKELTVFSAPPGVGKSLTLANLSRNFVLRKFNVVYVTLELAEEVVAKRFDSMFTGVSQVEIFRNIPKVSIDVRNQQAAAGRLFIKRMRESSTDANHLRAYLKELEIATGIVPDLLAVDYLDLMASVEKVSVENLFVKDKYVSEELRGIAHDHNLVLATASQLNRSALSAEISELNQGHIAGGISKANTADNLIAIIRNEQMMSRNEFCFKLLKTRSSAGVGKRFFMDFDPVSLVLKNRASDGQGPSPLGKMVAPKPKDPLNGFQV